MSLDDVMDAVFGQQGRGGGEEGGREEKRGKGGRQLAAAAAAAGAAFRAFAKQRRQATIAI